MKARTVLTSGAKTLMVGAAVEAPGRRASRYQEPQSWADARWVETQFIDTVLS